MADNDAKKEMNIDDPRLTAYAAGELDENARADVEGWLAEHSDAQAVVAELQSAGELLGEAFDVEPAGALTEDQHEAILANTRTAAIGRAHLAALQRAANGRTFQFPGQGRLLVLRRWLSLSAAAIVGMAIGIGLYAVSTRKPPATPPVAVAETQPARPPLIDLVAFRKAGATVPADIIPDNDVPEGPAPPGLEAMVKDSSDVILARVVAVVSQMTLRGTDEAVTLKVLNPLKGTLRENATIKVRYHLLWTDRQKGDLEAEKFTTGNNYVVFLTATRAKGPADKARTEYRLTDRWLGVLPPNPQLILRIQKMAQSQVAIIAPANCLPAVGWVLVVTK
jgi:anti-sigma factor RsiW